MAVGTIAVVAVAVLGSLTVLPAALSLLGDRLDRGRLPLIGRRRGAATVAARAGGGAVGAFWGRLAARATRRPATALAAGIVLLLALAVPALSMRTADLQIGATLRVLAGVMTQMHARTWYNRAVQFGYSRR